MNAKEVKHHFKKFFGYKIPQTQINVFSPEFIEFCIYIAAEQMRAVDGATPFCRCATPKYDLIETCAICAKPPRH